MNTAPIFRLLISAALVSTAALRSEAGEGLNLPRPGDTVHGYRVEQTCMAGGDSSVAIDLSELKLAAPRMLRVERAGEDSVYVTLDGSSRLLGMRGDSLTVLCEGQAGLITECLSLEADAPLGGDTLTMTGYYRLGRADGIIFREYGRSIHRTEPMGSIVSAEGDTLTHCYLQTSIRYGSLTSGTGAEASLLCAEAAEADSVEARVRTFGEADNPMTRSCIRERYYACGYRYPIFERERHAVYVGGQKADSSETAYYFPPHRMAELDDEENEEIRRALAERPRVSPISLKKNKGGSTLPETGLTLSTFPTVTTGITRATLTASESGQAEISVYSQSGTLIMSQNTDCGTSPTSLTIDLSGNAPGVYLISARVNESMASVKIVVRQP